MSRNPTGVSSRPGWAIAPEDSQEAQLPRRRWRILHNAKPRMEPVGPMPNWIKTPEDFVRWLASRLSLNELYTYFRDLEAIATLDKKTSSFFDHRDPAMVKRLGTRKL